MKKISGILLFIVVFFCTITSHAAVKLPQLISDGVVLQRDARVKIWGWADPGEAVKINFLNRDYRTKADKSGNWHIYLNNLPAGGPHKMQIKAGNEIEISNILIGDVWVCSGQSNMELPVRRVSWVYPDEIANARNDFIRQFKVPQKYDFKKPHEDYNSGSWVSANPESVLNFSAVAWFFARDLYKKYNVPIGLINSSLGGSPAEAWMSEEALKQFPEHYNEMQRFKNDELIKKISRSDYQRSAKWYTELNQKDKGHTEKTSWKQPEINTSDWKSIHIPGYWTGTEMENINGVVWFRRKFEVSAEMANHPALLNMGRIVDADSVFVNDKFAGTVSYQYPPRRYNLPAGMLKEGENTIVVRVVNNQGTGGFVPDKPYEITSDYGNIDLKGTWKYKIGATMPPLASQTFIRWKPGGLFNAMISPLTSYHIKGVIWYQGESNENRPYEYRKLFPALIKDWRNHWNQGDFPFLYVQLANYMEPVDQPTESNWAVLRESQLKTLSVPNTGMAVIIDIGEWNDIHPLKKKEVGQRLSLAAQKIAYHENNVVFSGPIYDSMEIDGNKIVLSFTHIGTGLVFKNGNTKRQFAISGPDQKFVWADAKIEGTKVVVWSDEVPNPVAVRYGWANDPENASLYNKEGLPASPFRTDEWKLNDYK